MPRTDLALDAAEFIKSKYYVEAAKEGTLPDGIEMDVQEDENVKITKIKVDTDGAAEAIGKEKGNYITLEIPNIINFEPSDFENLSHKLAEILREVCKMEKGKSVLIAGLGNWNVTADSLGPKTVSKVFVSRHIKQYMPDEIDERVNQLAAISPGVLGITGIETGEIICGTAEKIKPDIIIAIDALASGKIQRINTTIQVADTGISPGSGLGNKRMKLSKETMGVPVIAIGVPTVVDAVTFAGDAIDSLSERLGKNMIGDIAPGGNYRRLREYFDEDFNDLVVTPKDIDNVMEKLSEVIANGINLCVHQGLSLSEINSINC